MWLVILIPAIFANVMSNVSAWTRVAVPLCGRLEKNLLGSAWRPFWLSSSSSDDDSVLEGEDNQRQDQAQRPQEQYSAKASSSYNLGADKNRPIASSCDNIFGLSSSAAAAENWQIPAPVSKPKMIGNSGPKWQYVDGAASGLPAQPTTMRRMVARDQKAQILRGALWDESHYQQSGTNAKNLGGSSLDGETRGWQGNGDGFVRPPAVVYPNIDMSIPETVYNEGDNGKPSVDLVWDNLRWEAYQEAQREALLVSFLYSTILNHKSLESSLAFLLANRLQSPGMMVSTQLQSIIKDVLEGDSTARRYLRADMMAVRDRDPACNALTDVFLYFKGFHALQSHRVANILWKKGKHVLASYLQSQVSQVFQIDIHPNATMKSGIMLDHGTGIVIGSTASVGHNCSILHHVTLGGSGKKGVGRHPKVGNGVLLGAGATVLGPVSVGDGSQVGAGTLVISDLPAHCVAVGVPARIIGSFIDVTVQPSVGMDQMIEGNSQFVTFESEGI